MTDIILSPGQTKTCDAFREFLLDDTLTEFLLSGFAGSGKSFLVNYIVDLVRDEYKMIRLIHPAAREPKFYFTATTNKAARVLGNFIGADATTIHQLIGLTVRNNFSTGTTFLAESREGGKDLDNSIVVIDEGSMITRELLQWIRKKATEAVNCKVMYIGDNYQLPPINETSSPLFDAIPKAQTHFLTEIQRQAAGSPIIKLSQGYRDILDDAGCWPTPVNDGTTIIVHTDVTSWRIAVRSAYQEDHGPDDLRVLAWTNDRVAGYNKWIRKQMGYTSEIFDVGEIVSSNAPIIKNNRILAATDSFHKVLSIRPSLQNNIQGHMVEVRVRHGQDTMTVFQPDCWVAARQVLSDKAKIAKRTRDPEKRSEQWAEFFQMKNEWADFRPIHAQTVHKSQGSTYRKVFIDVNDIGRNNRWYEVARLMYVAITRASHEVHFYGALAERYIKVIKPNAMEAFINGPT